MLKCKEEIPMFSKAGEKKKGKRKYMYYSW